MPKTEVSAGGMAQNTSLLIIASRKAIRSTRNGSRLVYLQKMNLSCQHSRKRPHTLPFTIETVSMRQAAAWTASNLGHLRLNGLVLSRLLIAERTCMAKHGVTYATMRFLWNRSHQSLT